MLNSAYGFHGLHIDSTETRIYHSGSKIVFMDPVEDRTQIVQGGATRLVKGEKPNRQSPFNNRTSVAIAAIIAAEARMSMTT